MNIEFLLHGSIWLMFAWLVVGGLGLPVPEDLALLAAGVLVYRGSVSLAAALAITLGGVLAGDVLLFVLARRLGAAAYERPLFRRLLPAKRRLRFEAAYQRHGGKLVFFARHLVGVRAATFALAGIHGMPLRRFLLWDGLAACLSVPVIVGLGYLGALHIDRVRSDIATVQHYIAAAVLLMALGGLSWLGVRKRRARLSSMGPRDAHVLSNSTLEKIMSESYLTKIIAREHSGHLRDVWFGVLVVVVLLTTGMFLFTNTVG